MEKSMLFDKRKARAEMFASAIMGIVSPYLDEQMNKEFDVARKVYAEVMKYFYHQGVYVLTDQDRANAGLPIRNEFGYTEYELHHIENTSIQSMFTSYPIDIMKKGQ